MNFDVYSVEFKQRVLVPVDLERDKLMTLEEKAVGLEELIDKALEIPGINEKTMDSLRSDRDSTIKEVRDSREYYLGIVKGLNLILGIEGLFEIGLEDGKHCVRPRKLPE